MGTRLPDEEAWDMKRCFMCGGEVVRRLADIELGNIIIKNVPVEVCTRCGERYFETNVATFLQLVSSFEEEKRRELLGHEAIYYRPSPVSSSHE